ncbi:MAG: hypothetical protein JO283_20800, partial [Bradyrhizobium sp.]|nr:hypothetical protein [Bradyrhizobium sp.]
THPFLPTCGKEIDVIERATHWGEPRVVYLNDDGRKQSIAVAFTDIDPEDEFRQVAAGRAMFRTRDLLALSGRLEAIQALVAAKPL